MPITVARRFGQVELARPVVRHRPTNSHVVPGNAALPPHVGLIITRGVQEWTGLRPQDPSFAPVAHLLGWQTHAAQVRSDTIVRTLVRRHGQLVRDVAQAEAASLREGKGPPPQLLRLVPRTRPRHRAGWSAELPAGGRRGPGA